MVVNGHARRISRRRVNGVPAQPAGLRAYWRLNETSGNRLASVGGLHLVDTGSGVAIDSATGRINGAAKWISGTGNAGAVRSLMVSESSPFQVLGDNDNPIFVELWAHFDALNAGGTLFRMDIDGEDIFQVNVLDDGGTKKIDVSGQMDTQSYGHATQPTVVAATWYYIEGYYDPANDVAGVAVSADSGALQAISTLEGALEGAVGDPSTWNEAAAGFTIGDVGDTVAGDTYRICNVGIWNAIRSTGDRARSFNGGLGFDPTA